VNFIDLIVAGLNSLVGLGHIGTVCASVAPALRVGSSGLDLPGTIRMALTGTPTC
jgi:hypothetical protein